MNDNIDKVEIRRAIDRLQTEHPCHFDFNATVFDSMKSVDIIKKAIDAVSNKCQEDADIHIICEMAKLYLDGVKPTIKRPHGEWGKWVISEVRCPECLGYFDTDCYVKGELDKCPSCGARMKEGEEK